MQSIALVYQSSAQKVKKLKHHVKQREATFSTHRYLIIWKPRFVLIVCLKFYSFPKTYNTDFFERDEMWKTLPFPSNFLIVTKFYNKNMQLAWIFLLKTWNYNSKLIKSYEQSKRCGIFWDTWYVNVACICILHVCALLILQLHLRYKKKRFT